MPPGNLVTTRAPVRVSALQTRVELAGNLSNKQNLADNLAYPELPSWKKFFWFYKRVAKVGYQSRITLNFCIKSRITDNFFADYASRKKKYVHRQVYFFDPKRVVKRRTVPIQPRKCIDKYVTSHAKTFLTVSVRTTERTASKRII